MAVLSVLAVGPCCVSSRGKRWVKGDLSSWHKGGLAGCKDKIVATDGGAPPDLLFIIFKGQFLSRSVLYILLFISMLFWGGSWVNMKFIGPLDSALNIAFTRFFIAAISTAGLLAVLRAPFKIDKKSLFIALLTSLMHIFYTWLFYQALKHGQASIGGALVTPLIPIFTFIFMIILRQKRVRSQDFFALVLGVSGTLIVLNVWDFSAANLLAPQNLYYFACAITWAILTIISAKSTAHPLTFTLYLYTSSAAICALFFADFGTLAALHLSGHEAQIFWLNILLMSLGATVFANAFYFLATSKIGASEAASFSFLVPFCAIFLSWLFLGEELRYSTILGVLLTLWAVKIINDIRILKRRQNG